MPRDMRWTSLNILCTGMLMIVLDTTVVNVALPSIQREFGFSQSSLAWVVNAYLISFAGFLLLSGRLGDLIGSKRVFVAGLAVFTASSLLCGLAWSGWVLIAARFAQGVGGAMASAVILAMIVTMFEERGERARAMGIFSFIAAAGGSIGLLVGGALTQTLGWHWAFLINVPIGIATLVYAQRVLTGNVGIGLRKGADVFGAVAITLSMMLGVYAVVIIPNAPHLMWQSWASGGVATLLLIAFVARQAAASTPLVPLKLFASRNVSVTNVIEGLICAAMFGNFFLLALYLRGARHYDAIGIGLAFLPLTVAIGALSLGWAETLAERFGNRNLLITGLAISAAGLAWVTFVPLGGYMTTIFPPMLAVGVGMGIAFPPQMAFAMSGTTSDDAGVASGVLNTSAQVGGALGLAVLATVSDAAGYTAAFAVATVLLLASTALAVFLLNDGTLAKIDPERVERHPSNAPPMDADRRQDPAQSGTTG